MVSKVIFVCPLWTNIAIPTKFWGDIKFFLNILMKTIVTTVCHPKRPCFVDPGCCWSQSYNKWVSAPTSYWVTRRWHPPGTHSTHWIICTVPSQILQFFIGAGCGIIYGRYFGKVSQYTSKDCNNISRQYQSKFRNRGVIVLDFKTHGHNCIFKRHMAVLFCPLKTLVLIVCYLYHPIHSN